MFRLRFAYLVDDGKISQTDAAQFRDYVDFAGDASFTQYIYATLNLIPKDQAFDATARVMEALTLNRIEIERNKTAQSYEEQFWEQFDVIMELSEEGLARELPAFVTDPSNKAKVDALIAGRKADAIGHEESHRLEASA